MADTHDTAAMPSPTPDEAERVGANLQTAGMDKGSAIPPDELSRLTDDIVAALKTVYDPEIPADIYELGLIYKIDIDDDRNVDIDMTLTAPGCPVAGEMPGWVENAVGSVEGIQVVKVELVFDPPWTPERMSEEAQVAVGWF
jgi:FeS assembly SUF system protein